MVNQPKKKKEDVSKNVKGIKRLLGEGIVGDFPGHGSILVK